MSEAMQQIYVLEGCLADLDRQMQYLRLFLEQYPTLQPDNLKRQLDWARCRLFQEIEWSRKVILDRQGALSKDERSLLNKIAFAKEALCDSHQFASALA